MNLKTLFILVSAGLFGLLMLSGYKYLKIREENSELKNLLEKSAYSIDRENSALRNDIQEVFDWKKSPEFNKTKLTFDTLKVSSITKDSNHLKKDLIKLVKGKLDLNDTLRKFSFRFCNLPIKTNYYAFESLGERSPKYKLSDTVSISVRLVNVLGIMDNRYEIVSFSPARFGTLKPHDLEYTIPIRQIITNKQNSTDLKFDYFYVVKDNLSEEFDTITSSKNFQLLP